AGSAKISAAGRKSLASPPKLSAHSFCRAGGISEISPQGFTSIGLREPCHCHGRIGHPAGEAPLIVVPGEYPDETPVDDLRLRRIEVRRMRIVVEVYGDEFFLHGGKHALQLMLSGTLHRSIDIGHARFPPRYEAEVDNRHI